MAEAVLYMAFSGSQLHSGLRSMAESHMLEPMILGMQQPIPEVGVISLSHNYIDPIGSEGGNMRLLIYLIIQTTVVGKTALPAWNFADRRYRLSK